VFTLLATLYTLLFFYRYDTVVTVSTPHTTFVPGIVGQLLGRRWVVDVFDLWLTNAREHGYVDNTSLSFRLVAALERWAIVRSDHVIVITETMRDHFCSTYDTDPSRFSIVPFGIDTELFDSSDVDRSPGRVAYIGNLGDVHALIPFFEAFSHLPERYELHVVGTGKRRQELEKVRDDLGISERISFHGVRPRSEIPSILARADVAVVPLKIGVQLDYARPNKLIEAMAVGTPYVGSAVEEIEVVTEQSGAGIAVPNDPEAIGDAIRRISEDENRRQEMSTAGVQYVRENHDWEALSSIVAEALVTETTR
jgi:glycosyltransferase involved in cell wall biosynthesis